MVLESFCTSFQKQGTKYYLKTTLESPPNLVFPIFVLLALSASLISNYFNVDKYIDVFSEIMFIFCLGIKCITLFCSNFPWWIFWIAELISWNVIGTFGCLLTIAINQGHLFGNKLLWLRLSRRCSKWELGSGGFFRIFNITKSRINLSIRKLNQVLISVDFLFFLILAFFFIVVHFIYVTYY